MEEDVSGMRDEDFLILTTFLKEGLVMIAEAVKTAEVAVIPQ